MKKLVLALVFSLVSFAACAQQVPNPINAPASVTSGHGLCATSNPQQASDCGAAPGTGTVTTTGSPASGNLAKFSGSTSIVNGDLSGDCTTSATLAVTCTKTSGTNFGTLATQSFFPQPQGRLTLVSGTPVMTSDQTAKATIYYDCYVGISVPYYNGTGDQLDSVSGCEVSLTMIAGASTVGGDNTTTGGINASGVFDVWWVHGGANRICIANGAASSHSGGGWSSDTSGSTTARGTGYSAVHNTRGYWTNTNAITHCWNGSTDYGSVSADQATYLGTLYTTAAGQTGMAFLPSPASGGSSPCLCMWNAYNRVRVSSANRDNAASWNHTGTTWGSLHASTSNRVSFVDGLAQSDVEAMLTVTAQNVSGVNAFMGTDLDSTANAPQVAGAQGGGATGTFVGVTVPDKWAPQIGLHFVQAMEVTDNAAGNATFFGGLSTPTRQLESLILSMQM